MARAVRLDQLRLRVTRAADIESATARFTTTELNDYINESATELYDLIRAAYGQDYYRKTQTFTTTGSTATYNLASDFLDLISVDIPLGGNLVLTAHPYMENERNLYKFFPFGAWTLNQPLWYRLTGAVDSTGTSAQTISFIPTPTGTYTVNVNYVPVPTLMVADADTFDGIAGWEQYVVVDAAMKCALKQQNFELFNALSMMKEKMEQRIREMASEHDAGQAERVHDVYRDLAGVWW